MDIGTVDGDVGPDVTDLIVEDCGPLIDVTGPEDGTGVVTSGVVLTRVVAEIEVGVDRRLVIDVESGLEEVCTVGDLIVDDCGCIVEVTTANEDP